MSRPARYLTRMMIFVGIVVAVAAVLAPGLSAAFMANPVLNGVIIALLLLGVAYSFRLVLSLAPEIDWIENFRSSQPRPAAAVSEPQLLAPLAATLADQRGRPTMSAAAMRSLLDGISARMGEGREINRYLIGLLIFLGLLGTFWGLLQTISAVADVIADLNVESGELALIFADLKNGLEAPLAGMGTAFSSSLFGLAGSLILGFLELQTGQAHNRFFNELEDWLASSVRLTGGSGGMGLDGAEAGITLPAYMRALVEQTSENMSTLERSVSAMEDRQRQSADALTQIAEKLGTLSDQIKAHQLAAMKSADAQAALQGPLTRLHEALEANGPALDDTTRRAIQGIEARLARLTDDQDRAFGRVSAEIRDEIKVLTRTIAALAEAETGPDES